MSSRKIEKYRRMYPHLMDYTDAQVDMFIQDQERFFDGEDVTNLPLITVDKLETTQVMVGYGLIPYAAQEELSDGEINTLAVVRSYTQMGEDAVCYASQRTIAKRRCKGLQAINSHLRGLVDKGYLDCRQRENTTNMYILTAKAKSMFPSKETRVVKRD